jgi:hypothetical protein
MSGGLMAKASGAVARADSAGVGFDVFRLGGVRDGGAVGHDGAGFGLDDHAGRDRRIGEPIDQHERPRLPILAVAVKADRAVQGHDRAADLIEFQPLRLHLVQVVDVEAVPELAAADVDLVLEGEGDGHRREGFLQVSPWNPTSDSPRLLRRRERHHLVAHADHPEAMVPQ